MGSVSLSEMLLLHSGICIAVLAYITVATQCYPENFEIAWNYVESDAGGVWYTHLDTTGDFNEQTEACKNIGTGVTLAAALNAQENNALSRSSLLGWTYLGGFTIIPGSS